MFKMRKMLVIGLASMSLLAFGAAGTEPEMLTVYNFMTAPIRAATFYSGPLGVSLKGGSGFIEIKPTHGPPNKTEPTKIPFPNRSTGWSRNIVVTTDNNINATNFADRYKAISNYTDKNSKAMSIGRTNASGDFAQKIQEVFVYHDDMVDQLDIGSKKDAGHYLELERRIKAYDPKILDTP